MLNIPANEKNYILRETGFDVGKLPEMEIIEVEIFNSLADSTGVIREMCSHILNAGGKRLRPLLVLYSGLSFSPISKELLNAAVAAELIHMASLVHDDIIDSSAVRRNKPSVNHIWGNHYAVLCGDYLFARAFGILSKNRLIRSMDCMVDAIESMCCGEILQAESRFNPGHDINTYYGIITRKTASLLKGCCISGAFAAGADEDHALIMGEFGLNLGYAFQIVDDILDFCGNSDIMGKPRLEDFRQGILTLPVIYLLEDPDYSRWIKNIVFQKEFTDRNIKRVLEALVSSGAISRAYKTVTGHLEKARECLGFFEDSQYVRCLRELTYMVQERTK